MSVGGVIDFNDMFDFSNSSNIRKAITLINELKQAYVDFSTVVTGGVMQQFNDQQKRLAESARLVAAATNELNLANKASYKQIADNAKAMADLEAKLKAINAAQAAAAGVNKAASDSIDGLTAKLRQQIKEYNTLSKAKDSLKMGQLAQDIGATTRELTALKNALNQTVASAAAAKGSYQALDAETKKLISDLKAMENGMNKDNAAAAALATKIKENTDRLKEFDRAIGQNFRNVGNYGAAFGKVNGVLTQLGITLFTLQSIRQGFDKVFSDTVKFDAFNKTIELVSGNSAKGAVNLEFLREIADRLKLDLAGVTEGFKNFSGATLGSQFEGEKTRKIFEAVSEATAVMHLNADTTSRVFLALGQIISKGKVQAQELRLQLGNNLPGALKLFADGLGITTKELDKMMEQGQITSDMLLPFADRLSLVYGPKTKEAVTSLQASINDFNNTVTLTITDTGLADFFKVIINGAKDGVIAVRDLIKWFGEHKNAAIILTTILALLNTTLIATTASFIRNTIASIANTVATKAGAAATAIAEVATAAYWATIGVLTRNIGIVTAAQTIWNAAMSASPIGILVLAVGALALAINKLNEESREEIMIMKQKTQLTQALNNQLLYVSDIQDKINESIRNFINLSQQERRALEDTIKLRKQELQLKIDSLNADLLTVQNASRKTTIGQNFVLAGRSRQEGETYAEFNKRVNDERLAMQNKNAEEATEGMSKKVNELRDQLKKYDEELKQVTDITHAYEDAMKTSTETMAGLQLRERLLRVTLANNKEGTEEYEKAIKALGATLAEIDRRDPEKRIKALARKENKVDNRDPEMLLKQQRDAMSSALKATSDYLLSEIDLEYAASEDSVENVVAREEEKLNIIRKSYKQRLELYFQDVEAARKALDSKNKYEVQEGTEYFELLKESNEEEKKAIEAVQKARDEADRENKRRQKDEARVIKQNIALRRQERNIQIETIKGEIGIKVASGKMTQQEADEQYYQFRKEQLSAEIEDAKAALAEMSEADEGYFDRKKELNDLEKQMVEDKYNHEIQLAKTAQDRKIALQDAWFNFAAQSSQALFNIGSSFSEAAVSQMEQERDKMIEIAGDNATRREAIEKKYNRAIAREKRKAAIADKIGAIFQTGINTAQGITKTIAEFGMPAAIPFVAMAAALGALETAVILAKPIPAYESGRRTGPEEWARVNEKGAELIGRPGKWRIVGGGEETITKLEAGEQVITAPKTAKMLTDEFENDERVTGMMVSLLKGTGVVMQRENHNSERIVEAILKSGITQEGLFRAMDRALSQLPINEFAFDGDDFTHYVKTKTQKINEQRSRQRMGGKG